jgi:hypothetical protein
MARLPDIDIDVKDRLDALRGHDCVPASLLQDGELKKHPTGVFYQLVPIDPVTRLAAFPSEGKELGDVCEAIGYQKLDVIPNHAYADFSSREDVDAVLNDGFDWDWLLDRELVEGLHHIGSHFDLVSSYAPRNIGELAALLAVIRPGKIHLKGLTMEEILSEVWKKDGGSAYTFKKSHAFAYALMVMVQAAMSIRCRTGFQGTT